MKMNHQELQELMAAYALHALDGDELTAVEEHLQTCALCRAEVDSHRETAALLGSEPSLAPDLVWEQIEARLDERPTPSDEVAPLLQFAKPTVVAHTSKASPIRNHRYQWMASVAASILLLLGGFIGWNAHGNTKPSAPTAQQNIALAAQQAQTTAGARTITLRSPDGKTTANAVLLRDGHGYLTNVNLPALPASKTYQLWAMVGSTPISAGVLGTSPTVSGFSAAGNVSALAISEEPAGGSVTPTIPLLSGLI